MLQSIREYTQGWIAGTIIGIIILTFALWGIHSYFEGNAASNTVASINGIDITREQLSVAFERLRRQVQSQTASAVVSAKDENALKDRALQTLIDIEVLKQASIREGFRISNRQIDNYLQRMPDFLVEGQFSLERFQEILSSSMLSTSEFLDLIKTSMLIDQPKLGTVLSSFSLPDETNDTIALVNQERDIQYIHLPEQYFLARPVTISQAQIDAYYKAHQNEFITPEQVNVDYIELSLKTLAATIVPTDAMLQNFYSENINSYTQPMSWKITDIEIPVAENAPASEVAQAKEKANAALQAIKSGKEFTQVASGYKTALSGQNWMTLNEVPAELQKTVAELVHSGLVSEPVKTSKGFVIVKVLDVKEPAVQPFDQAKDKVKEAYVRQHAEEKFAQLREQLADMTYEHADSLKYAATNLNIPVQTSELFTKDKPGKDIAQYKKVREIAFSNDVLNLQNNSDVIQVNQETAIVLRAKSHIASTLLPIKDVTADIEKKLKAAYAETRAAQFAQDLKAKLEAGAVAEALTSIHQLTWNKVGYIGRYSTKVDSAILDTAFSLANPATKQGKRVYGVARVPDGYAIIALNAVKPGQIADQKQFTVFAEQIQNSEGMLEYELYKRSQISTAKIKL